MNQYSSRWPTLCLKISCISKGDAVHLCALTGVNTWRNEEVHLPSSKHWPIKKQPTVIKDTCVIGESNIFLLSVAHVSQWSGNGWFHQFSGGGGGIKRGADVCSCRPDYGVEWMVGEPAEFVCTGSFGEGYGGLGWWQEIWGGELWLKGAFPLKCLPACTPANTITSLVGSASWTNEGLRVEGRGFEVLGSWLLVFSLPLSFSACPTSKMKGELRSRCFEACIYTEYTLFTPSSIPQLSSCCMYSEDLSLYLHIQLNTLNRLTLYI